MSVRARIGAMKPATIRIIGIDPGTRFTGIGIIDRDGNRLQYVHSETIKTVNQENLEQKLILIFDRITEIIKIKD